MIWSASLVSNFGSLIQAVGASWMMTSIAPSADMVALVQASTTLPIMLLSLTSDVVERARMYDIGSSILQQRLSQVPGVGQVNVGGGALPAVRVDVNPMALNRTGLSMEDVRTTLAAANTNRPKGSVSGASQAWSITTTDQLLKAAGGIIVAKAGPSVAFLLNSLSYVGLITVLALWRRPKPAPFLPPENMVMAMGAGLRYARLSPDIRTVLIRGAAFGVLGSSIWALMPLIARDLIGGNAVTYGALLGAFGSGA